MNSHAVRFHNIYLPTAESISLQDRYECLKTPGLIDDPKCEIVVSNYCKSHRDDSACSCINSKLTNPLCRDPKCANNPRTFLNKVQQHQLDISKCSKNVHIQCLGVIGGTSDKSSIIGNILNLECKSSTWTASIWILAVILIVIILILILRAMAATKNNNNKYNR